MSVELKPCPFCGESANFELHDKENERGREYIQSVLSCCIVTMEGNTCEGNSIFRKPSPEWVQTARQGLAERWNERPTQPPAVGVDVSDEMVARYVAAVNAHLAALSPKDWEIERLDPAKAIAKVAGIGLTEALRTSGVA